MRPPLNIKRSSEGGVKKTSIAHTITYKGMTRAESIAVLQNVHRKVPVLSVYGLFALKWCEQYDNRQQFIRF